MIRLLAVAVLVAAAMCASACGGGAPAGPPEIRLGIDACDGCGMVIAEMRYAGAAVADDGAMRRVLKFDDVGCLARWEAGAKGVAVRERWVHDRSTEAWIDAASATYVQSGELITPMGSGLVAFSNRLDAAELAGSERATLSWDAILARASEAR